MFLGHFMDLRESVTHKERETQRAKERQTHHFSPQVVDYGHYRQRKTGGRMHDNYLRDVGEEPFMVSMIIWDIKFYRHIPFLNIYLWRLTAVE